ncbi:MAG: hypothetical protein AAF289_16230 [Cyanobacteria bacterium P01_A01_bin.135]
MSDLTGAWLGTYWQNGQPTRFEVTFVQANNALSGSILDDSSLGEARLSGDVTGRRVTFTKRYITAANPPIQYTGTVAEDDGFMSGIWQIEPQVRGGRRQSGKWEAHRTGDDLVVDLQQQLERQPALAAPASAK